MRRAFHAQCTLIDHQLRLVIGTLRERLLLDDTVLVFTSDHGDMLADHGLFAKRMMLDGSARVPLLVMGVAGCDRATPGTVDDRLAGMQDIMPTLLDLAGIDRPASCTGRSLVGDAPRETLYCEALEGQAAMRMVTDGRWKLIWHPAGNRFLMFDRRTDPDETRNLAERPEHAAHFDRLSEILAGELYGADLDLTENGRLVGCAADEVTSGPNRGLSGQRGLHYPEPPADDPGKVVGAP